ncbi:hypothetical protein [Ferrimonas pelagia]|uniref:Uncharacterized protein n=1 Tax=Ferrimonas pelagia TaxID=1177826 RepID=A0ABP9FHP8_9GAMM
MILCIQLEKITEYLKTLAPLIDRYKAGDYGFTVKAIDWLEATEKLMSELRLPEGAELSALRAQILKAGDLAQDDEGKRSRSAIRRACSAAAADALQRAEQILRHRQGAAEDKLQHFEDKLCEAVTAAVLVDAVPTPPTTPRTLWLQQAWTALSQHQSIRPTTVYLATSLFSADRMFLLDRVMNRLFEKELSVHQSAAPTSPDLVSRSAQNKLPPSNKH